MFLKTGLKQLDDLIGGGINERKSVLVDSLVGIDEELFVQQLLSFRLSKGDHAVYLVNNKLPEAVRINTRKLESNFENFEDKGIFAFFDCYSEFLGISSEETFSSSLVLDELKIKLFEALIKMKNKNTLLVVDSLSNFFDIYSPEEVFFFLKECLEESKKIGVTSIFMLVTIHFHNFAR